MDKHEWKRTLTDDKNLALFAHMPEKVFACAQQKKLKKGMYVVEKEQEIKEILLCCKGKMEVRNEFRNGMIYSFDYAEPISYVGVMELLAGSEVYSAYLQAKTDCEFLIVTKSVFFDWFYKDQWLILEVLTFVSKSMYVRSFNSGEQRICPANYLIVKYLLELFKEVDKKPLFIEVSKEEIGTLFCISTRTVHRVLKQLKEEDMLTVNRKGIVVTKSQYELLNKKFEEMRKSV